MIINCHQIYLFFFWEEKEMKSPGRLHRHHAKWQKYDMQ